MAASDRRADDVSAVSPSSTRRTRSASAAAARARILDAARTQFRARGYDGTSLAEIGKATGLTRGAVLYHFRSKANLLESLLEPFTTSLDRHLDEMEAMDSPPGPEVVLDAVLGMFSETRFASDLLARDIISNNALGVDLWSTARARRLMRLLAPGSDTDLTGQIRAYAALGAMIRPLAHLPAGPLSPAHHDVILASALGALRVSAPRPMENSH